MHEGETVIVIVAVAFMFKQKRQIRLTAKNLIRSYDKACNFCLCGASVSLSAMLGG